MESLIRLFLTIFIRTNTSQQSGSVSLNTYFLIKKMALTSAIMRYNHMLQMLTLEE